MWWFVAPVAAKVIYDVVTEDDTPSYSSNYDEQKRKAEQQAQQEQAERDRKQRVARLEQQLTQSSAQRLQEIKADHLCDADWDTLNKSALNDFAQANIEDRETALAALSLLSKTRVRVKTDSSKHDALQHELQALSKLEIALKALS